MIERALNSSLFADEILVIDGGSTDKTLEILNNPLKPWSKKIRVIENKWPGFRTQRNLLLKEAKHDWVLILDSDEAISLALQEKIKLILSEENPHPTWKVKRIEYFLGKQIHHGIWNPSLQDRFFHRKDVQYVNEIHEYPLFPVTPKIILEPIYHSPLFHPEHFLSKMNKYTSIEAKDRILSGKRTNVFHMIMSGPAMFFKNYFYYSAYKDGIHGVAISVLEGVSRWVRHVKMWQFQNETKHLQNIQLSENEK